jgi:hypothetical protein
MSDNRQFMTDRKAGEFYIIKSQPIAMTLPYGFYMRICIEHYQDYGKTLAGTYCHDLTRTGVVTGIKESNIADKITVYPNPVSNNLIIKSDENINSVEIINIIGQTALRQQATQKDCIIDLQYLPTGIYFLRLQIENSIVTKKIIKQ